MNFQKVSYISGLQRAHDGHEAADQRVKPRNWRHGVHRALLILTESDSTDAIPVAWHEKKSQSDMNPLKGVLKSYLYKPNFLVCDTQCFPETLDSEWPKRWIHSKNLNVLQVNSGSLPHHRST